MKRRTVIFLSDGTGITAENLGLSLISQFEGIKFNYITLPFIDSIEKAQMAANQFEKAFHHDGEKPIVFSTIVSSEIRALFDKSPAYIIDFFQTFIPGLENQLNTPSSPISGQLHSVANVKEYNTRIEAVNFALDYDDGAKTKGYESADVILIGVSRCGKTPTSLYLAMQFGISAANYPLADEDLKSDNLPRILRPFRDKLFGLTIDPQRLHHIRTHRHPHSEYASLAQCSQEVRAAEAIYQHENIPYLSSTHLSIEELSTKLMVIAKINRRFR